MRGTVGAVEVAVTDKSAIIVNPTNEELTNAKLLCTVAGNRNGIVMLDGFAKAITEGDAIEAFGKAHVGDH